MNIGAVVISAVKEAVEAYSAYCNVKDYYIDARVCGKKI